VLCGLPTPFVDVPLRLYLTHHSPFQSHCRDALNILCLGTLPDGFSAPYFQACGFMISSFIFGVYWEQDKWYKANRLDWQVENGGTAFTNKPAKLSYFFLSEAYAREALLRFTFLIHPNSFKYAILVVSQLQIKNLKYLQWNENLALLWPIKKLLHKWFHNVIFIKLYSIAGRFVGHWTKANKFRYCVIACLVLLWIFTNPFFPIFLSIELNFVLNLAF